MLGVKSLTTCNCMLHVELLFAFYIYLAIQFSLRQFEFMFCSSFSSHTVLYDERP